MTLAAELPDDILFNIFQNFKPDELAKIERVCRSWHQSARAHQSLWRDGSLYNTKGEFCPIQYYNRFKCLAQRNGGKFTRLFLNICILSLSEDDISKLLMVLPLIKVPDLWIVVGYKRHCPDKHTNCDLSPSILRKVKRIECIQAVMMGLMKVLVNYTTLSKLRLSSSVDVGDINLKHCGDPANWPINQCKFEELHLLGLRYDILFPKVANFEMLSKARSITLNFTGKAYKQDEKRVWLLIETAKDTLEYCFLERFRAEPHHIADEQTIVSLPSMRKVLFPALKTLSVDVDNTSGTLDREIDILQYSMDCPVLEELYVSVMTPISMLQDLIKGQIKFISVGVRDKNQAILNEAFRKCKKLEKLTLWHQFDVNNIYEGLIESTKGIPLKELSVLLIDPELFEGLLSFLENRFRMKGTSKIQRLSFLHQAGPIPETVLWYLRNLVKEVKVYSDPPNLEFKKILEKYNGYHFFEGSESHLDFLQLLR